MGHRVWLIERLDDGALLGTIGCTVWFHRVEIGFALGSEFWGRGYMPEALERVCEAAFSDARIHRVQGLCDEENAQSARVMEKAGMTFEGKLRSYGYHPNRSKTPRDCLMYALVRPN
jgi:ribosomal-protein-alanine N-acetyltransferase